jgi:hypothetical protein
LPASKSSRTKNASIPSNSQPARLYSNWRPRISKAFRLAPKIRCFHSRYGCWVCGSRFWYVKSWSRLLAVWIQLMAEDFCNHVTHPQQKGSFAFGSASSSQGVMTGRMNQVVPVPRAPFRQARGPQARSGNSFRTSCGCFGKFNSGTCRTVITGFQSYGRRSIMLARYRLIPPAF